MTLVRMEERRREAWLWCQLRLFERCAVRRLGRGTSVARHKLFNDLVQLAGVRTIPSITGQLLYRFQGRRQGNGLRVHQVKHNLSVLQHCLVAVPPLQGGQSSNQLGEALGYGVGGHIVKGVSNKGSNELGSKRYTTRTSKGDRGRACFGGVGTNTGRACVAVHC